MDLILAKQRYIEQKKRAKQRKIDWLLSFEEWCNIWQKSGKYDYRGIGKGSYVMARFNDIGPYSTNNVKIILNEDNIREAAPLISAACKGRIPHNFGKPHSKEAKLKMREAKLGVEPYNKGKPRETITCPHCNKIVDVANAKRWHFDKCKSLMNDK